MKRPLLILILAGVVTFPLAEAITSTTAAFGSGTEYAWLQAAGDLATAGASLLLAVLVAALTDRSARRPLWLLDWRFLLRERRGLARQPSAPGGKSSYAMATWHRLAARLSLAREDGQGMVEYAFLLVSIAVVTLGALQLVGQSALGPMSDAAQAIGELAGR